MTVNELRERGISLRKSMFGEAAVDARMKAAGAFGAPLQDIINAYAYGDVWSRDGLDPAARSLVMLGILAARGCPEEFRVHMRGALANGCTAGQIQGVLLQVAMYCGIPAAIEPHRIAAEMLGEVR